jgi:hypothetical protein
MLAPAVDPTAEGPYDPALALVSTPDIDTDLGLVAAADAAGCIPGIAYKGPDDGDPSTQADTAVYYCGIDGRLHVFPHFKVFFSWYAGFDGIQPLDADTLRSLRQGAPVTYRPGSRLVKTPDSEKTYAVSRGGLLRWAKDESAAAALYGQAWHRRVTDIPEAFMSQYRIGRPVGE